MAQSGAFGLLGVVGTAGEDDGVGAGEADGDGIGGGFQGFSGTDGVIGGMYEPMQPEVTIGKANDWPTTALVAVLRRQLLPCPSSPAVKKLNALHLTSSLHF